MSSSENCFGLDDPELYLEPAQVFHGVEHEFPEALMLDIYNRYLQFTAVQASGRLVVAQLTLDRYYIFASPPDTPHTKDELLGLRQPAGSNRAIVTASSNGEITKDFELLTSTTGSEIIYSQTFIRQPTLSDVLLDAILGARILKPEAAEVLDLLRSTNLRESNAYGQEYFADESRTLGTLSIEALETYSQTLASPSDAAASLNRLSTAT
jgi:hypothetical protein